MFLQCRLVDNIFLAIQGDDVPDSLLIYIVDKPDGGKHYYDRGCSKEFGAKNCVNEITFDKDGNITYLHIINDSSKDKKYYSSSSIPFEINCTRAPCSADGDVYTEKASDTVPFESYHNYFDAINSQ